MKLTKSMFLMLSVCLAGSAWAQFITGMSLGVGNDSKDSLWGSRLSLLSAWPVWFKDWPVNITGYWDGSIGYWHSSGDEYGNHKNLGVFALAPVFKLQANRRYIKIFDPYLQAGIGGAIATNTHMGHNNFGGFAYFEDIVGIGVRFGKKMEYDISYNYLHYSNARIAPPNDGLTAHYFMSFSYHFA